MKSRKAPDSDEMTVDILKAGGEPVLRWLVKRFADVWINEQMVKEWSVTTLIRLYKNEGDKKIRDNYRGIALLNITINRNFFEKTAYSFDYLRETNLQMYFFNRIKILKTPELKFKKNSKFHRLKEMCKMILMTWHIQLDKQIENSPMILPRS
ncbi:unnamed protein product [Rotaria socialis]